MHQADQQAIEQAKIADKANDRKLAQQLKQMEIDAENTRTDKENVQQSQAAQLATQAEAAQNKSEEQIAMLTMRVQDHQEHVREANKVLLAEMKANSDAALLVLQQLMAAMTPTPAAGGVEGAEGSSGAAEAPKAPDLSAVIQPLLQSITDNNATVSAQFTQHSQALQAMMGQLSEGMQALHKAHSAPRVARYIKDASGNNIGVESVPNNI